MAALSLARAVRSCSAMTRAGIRLLSHDQAVAVLRGLESLNPYAAGTVKEFVKIEAENFDPLTGAAIQLSAIVVSTKRYGLYERTANGPRFRKCSTHGLGFYRAPVPNPDGWEQPWPYWV